MYDAMSESGCLAKMQSALPDPETASSDVILLTKKDFSKGTIDKDAMIANENPANKNAKKR